MSILKIGSGARVDIGSASKLNISSNILSFAPNEIANLGLWWDFSDNTTTFKDTNRTIPATTTADPVLGVTDKSGSNNHGTGSGVPALVNNGKGTNNIVDLQSAFSYITGPNVQFPWPITVVVVAPEGSTNRVLIGSSTTTGISDDWNYWAFAQSAPNMIFRVDRTNGGGTVVNTDKLWNAGNANIWHMVTIQLNEPVTADNRIGWDNVWLPHTVQNSGPLSGVASGNIRIGAASSGGNLWRDPVGEVIVYNRLITDNEVAGLWNYLNTKWQII